MATSAGSADVAPAASQATTHAQQVLSTLGQDHHIEGERYRSLLNQAERIRLCLLILGRLQRRIERENPDLAAGPILEQYLQISGDFLYSVGLSLTNGAGLAEARQDLTKLAQSSDRWRALPREDLSAFLRAMLEDAQLQIDALAGQLRTAVDLADHATPEGELSFEQREASKPEAGVPARWPFFAPI